MAIDNIFLVGLLLIWGKDFLSKKDFLSFFIFIIKKIKEHNSPKLRAKIVKVAERIIPYGCKIIKEIIVKKIRVVCSIILAIVVLEICFNPL
jgi:hypothetical protein